MLVICLSHACHIMLVTRLSYACHMLVICLSHACHMLGTCLAYDASTSNRKNTRLRLGRWVRVTQPLLDLPVFLHDSKRIKFMTQSVVQKWHLPEPRIFPKRYNSRLCHKWHFSLIFPTNIKSARSYIYTYVCIQCYNNFDIWIFHVWWVAFLRLP